MRDRSPGTTRPSDSSRATTRRVRSSAAVIVFAAGLSGCAGVHLHNASNAKTAQEAGQKYAAAKVSELGADEAKNLDAMLEAELQVARATHQLRLDMAFLRMADDRTSVWDWWSEGTQERRRRDLVGPTGFRAILDAGVDVRKFERNVKANAEVLSVLTLDGFDCNDGHDAGQPPLDGVVDEERPKVATMWRIFVLNCEGLSEARARLERLLTDNGQTNATVQELAMARLELRAVEGAAAAARTDLAAARAELDAAKRAGEDPKADEKIRDKAKVAETALEYAAKVDAALKLGLTSEAETRETLEQLRSVLTSAATGEAADQETLGTLAAKFPELVGDVGRIRKRYSAPPVSNLVLEHQRQTQLLAEHRARRDLIEQRIAFLERKQAMELAEIEQWKNLRDGLCNFAFGERAECETMARKTTAEADGTSTVTYKAKARESGDEITDPDRTLDRRWADLLTQSSVPGHDSYWIQWSVAAFARVMHARLVQDEIDYRLIDLLHQESLLDSRSAIAAWNTLAETPIAQLVAFHESGITQEELAQMITRILSFGALAVGAAQ